MMELTTYRHKIPLFDYMKGIGIILVVTGHAINGVYKDVPQYWNNILSLIYDAIISFHMSLFFFVSGALYEYSNKINHTGKWELLKKKIIDLGIPYLVGTIIFCLIGECVGISREKYNFEALLKCLYKPIAHFWFMYVELWIFLIISFINLKKKYKYALILILAIGYSSFFLLPFAADNNLLFLLKPFISGYLFFLIGNVVISDQLYEKKILQKNTVCMLAGLLTFSVIFLISEYYGVYSFGYIKMILSFAGVYSLAQVVMCIFSNDECKRNIIFFLGERTMPIYLYHPLFVASSRKILLRIGASPMITVFLTTLFGIIGPYLLYKIGTRIVVLNILYYPRRALLKEKV